MTPREQATIVLTLNLLIALVQPAPFTLLEGVIRFYRQNGILFRENKFLGSKPIHSEYDFIVVGAGPAGCILTNRLSKVPEWSVLLLEAGLDDNMYTDIPIMSTYLWFTKYNWMYQMEQQPGACLGLDGQTCPWPAGKGLGGGSIINAMIYTRGNRRDYDGWQSLGNPGWGYDDVLPYFLKFQKINIPDLLYSPYHGRKGTLSIEYTTFRTKLLGGFLEAGQELGYNLVDYNNPNTHVGFSTIQGTIHRGRRMGASRAFLHPIRKRKNFHVTNQAQVTRVIIDPITKRATGVEFIKRGQRRIVRARREVIVSAGAFNSPQILMLSGVGPAEHLRDMGIPVIQDLRVGDNLQEHLSMAGLTFLVNTTDGIVVKRMLQRLPIEFPRYLKYGSGMFTSMGAEGLGYIKTKFANTTEDYPDIEFIFLPLSLASDGGSSLRKTMEVTDEIYNSVYSSVSGMDAWSIWPMILYPRSRGQVRLRNRDPLTPPLIYGNFLSHPLDVAIIVEGLKMALEVGKTRAMRQFGSRLHRVPLPQCAHLGFGTDAYWECSVRHITTQLHHQSGTCKMGPLDDPGAVVDAQLRVYGVRGLRVADASIMPTVTGGHTMAPAYMIGEKAAAMIKQAWGVR